MANNRLWLKDIKTVKEIKCPHCRFIESVFGEIMECKNFTNREYWIMTEIFCYLHGDKDYCDYDKNIDLRKSTDAKYGINFSGGLSGKLLNKLKK